MSQIGGASVTLRELANRFGLRVAGADDTVIRGVCTIDPGVPGCISFLANSQYRKFLAQTQASAVIVSEQDAADTPVPTLISDAPYLTYAQVAGLFVPKENHPSGVSSSADVDPVAIVDPSASIGPCAVIEAGARIGPNVRIGPGTVVCRDAQIGAGSWLVGQVYVGPRVCVGERVILHPGVVVGADGFGLAHDGEKWIKVPQLGSVEIGDDVEVGANTTIDRGALDNTVLERGVKLDNQIQVAHNVHIGAHTVIAGCVGIAGSAVIGKRCMIGGGAGIGGHLQVADDVTITAMSMVTHSIPKAGVYSSGGTVDDNRTWQKNAARFRQLDPLARRLIALEKRVADYLEQKDPEERGQD
ncbi:MAG: UDP-3-O-(3-hydroxymyristoyl)glucosamine N-acyltransferase [Pseudomonadota bacterium]|nr:UDP-3-O-(3-hydroxymyristoyl)glucosamine N-acyltransferase [Pseudomonadota bacterium]